MIHRTIKNKQGQVVTAVVQLFFVTAIILLVANIAQAPTHAEAQAICYKRVTNPTTLEISTVKTDCTTGELITGTTPTPSSGSGEEISQDLFKFINESPDSSTGNQGTPTASGANTTDTGIHSLGEVQGLGGTQTSNTLTGGSCGGGASGGSVSNSLAGLFGGAGGAQSVIACINGGSSCPGLAENLAGNALAQQAGKLGIPPGLVGTALGVVSGNTSPTQAILGLAAQKAPAILQALFGGKGGGVASAVGSALHSGAANSIGGIAGGAIGGIAGGIAGGIIGGLTGGGSVPVDVTTKDLLKNIAATRQFTEGLHTQETCTNGIASALAGQATADWVAATVRHVEDLSIKNPREFSLTLEESVFKNFVGGITGPDSEQLKQLLFATYKEDTSPNKILQSRNVSVEKDALAEFKAAFIDKTDSPLSLKYTAAYNALAVQLDEARKVTNEAIDDGVRSQVVCLGRDGKPNGKTRLEDCGGNFSTDIHASLLSDQLKNAVAAGPKQVADVDKVTDNVNPFLAQFVQRLFVQGLPRLSKRGSAAIPAPNAGGAGGAPRPSSPSVPGLEPESGDNGTPEPGAVSENTGTYPRTELGDFGNASYLDQVAGTAENTSIASARSFLTRNVSLSIAAEESYQGTLADMVQDIVFAAGAFDRVRLCYVDLTKNISTGISTATALEKANQASSTIAAIFVPQIERRVTEIAASELVVGELVRLAGLAREANTADELNVASDSFDALLSAGLVHSETDLIFLENDRQAAVVALTQVANEADDQLAECQQF